MNESPSDAVKPVVWKPTSEETMKALLMVLCDEARKTDCLFWHGSPTNSTEHNFEAAKEIANLYHSYCTRTIIINGLSRRTCKERHLCYPGHEDFTNELEFAGVSPQNITAIPPANHTAAESETLLVMMKERGWESVTIVSQPHHQLRCFLQIIASMKKLGIFVSVYNRTSPKVSWREPPKKPLLGGGEIDGTLVDHVQGEHDRIVKYADPTGTGYSLNATIPEMFEYLKTRDSIK